VVSNQPYAAYEQEDAITCKPHGYFNMSLFSCAPTDLYGEFEAGLYKLNPVGPIA
jgi:hypothetical protein